MKRGIEKIFIALLFIVLLSSTISAEIIFTQPLKSTYNLGDEVFVPITIKAANDISGVISMNLICNGTEINFYKNGINLVSGAEKSLDSSLILINNIIGGNSGACKVKVVLGDDYALSSEFKISNLLTISGILKSAVFNSGDIIQVNGKVTRETGENANGLIEATILTNDINQNISQAGTIDNGNFAINISLPANIKAGSYFINLYAYEMDSNGLPTNTGNAQYNISVNQVPTNLELILGNTELNPGDSLNVKSILHDQTGDPIDTKTFITLKDSNDKIIEQQDVNANESFTYAIAPNEPPATWKVLATSQGINAEQDFLIKQKESVDIQIINKTILVTNNGNVPYNKTLLVKIGDTPLNVPISLAVGENKKYILTAPDGEYQVKISGGEDNEVTGTMSLTGNAVGIKEANWSQFGIIFGWAFLIAILAAGFFFAFKRIRKKPFFGHMTFKKNGEGNFPVVNNNTFERKSNKTEMSLSMKGEQQDASVICVKIKGLKDVRNMRGSSVLETVQKITQLGEDNNAAVYENQDYLFLIFAPSKTRTFKNEKITLETAEEIHGMLIDHNRKFSQKIDFGISLNYGAIIAKVEGGTFKFMSLGTLVTISKKVASLSNGEILLSDKMNDLVRLFTKTEKQIREGTPVFILGTIKKEDEETKKFINRFMERQRRGE